MREKIEQTASATNAWLRFDLFNRIWQLTPFAMMPLADKLDAMHAALAETLQEAPAHIAGLVFSDGAALVVPHAVDETCEHVDGYVAMRRALPPLRARETLIFPTNAGPEDGALISKAYASESIWPDDILTRAGLPPRDAIFAPSS